MLNLRRCGMEENIEELYKKLFLMEQEDEELLADVRKLLNERLKNGLCLLVRVLTERPYNKEAFKTTVKRPCRYIKSLLFCDLSPSIMFVEFSDGRDKAPAVWEGPWFFDKRLVLLKEVDGTLQMHQISFTHALFWI